MGQFQRLLSSAILLIFSLLTVATYAVASDEDPAERALSAGRSEMLERHYGRAIQVFRQGLKVNPNNNRLRLELGRAYLSSGSDSSAIRLFREILDTEPDNREARLELGRALGYQGQYHPSDEIYQELLAANPADEAAAIGLASNLLHQSRREEARKVVESSLAFHPNSLRLQEYKDRIEGGVLSGEERPPGILRNQFASDVEFLNDSAGNHSWRSMQRLDLGIRPGLTSRFSIEHEYQHSRDDSFEAVQDFTGELRWRPQERLFLTAGVGAVRFNARHVRAVYETAVAFQPERRLLLEASFSRVPVTPDAEATEHKLTAQGWETLVSWTPSHWQLSGNWSRRHYSDGNIAGRQNADVAREFQVSRLTFVLGYRYRRYHFDQELEHGYFSPNSYQRHLGTASVSSRLGKHYRGSFMVRSGLESPSTDSPFRTAWEIHARNEVRAGNWTLELDYSKYHLVQDTGAFRADAGRFEFAYHF